jgi:hypothetical protein
MEVGGGAGNGPRSRLRMAPATSCGMFSWFACGRELCGEVWGWFATSVAGTAGMRPLSSCWRLVFLKRLVRLGETLFCSAALAGFFGLNGGFPNMLLDAWPDILNGLRGLGEVGDGLRGGEGLRILVVEKNALGDRCVGWLGRGPGGGDGPS